MSRALVVVKHKKKGTEMHLRHVSCPLPVPSFAFVLDIVMLVVDICVIYKKIFVDKIYKEKKKRTYKGLCIPVVCALEPSKYTIKH